MPSAKVTSKGQITIPVDVREKLGLRPGTRVSFVATARGSYELRADDSSVKALKGAVAWSGDPVTLEDMDRAIASGAGASMA